MPKAYHETRDAVHAFVRFDSGEREVIDTAPVQRLRFVHQLAMTYLVYPGATHRRFEHSLGVMALASRVYDVVTDPEHIRSSRVRGVVPRTRRELEYWRYVLRLAALCHDVGHLPFSHAAERDLLPAGWNHERLTVEVILSDQLRPVWQRLRVSAADIAKVAVGPKHYRGPHLDEWETILSEMISGDALGADRMDYLLRDSLHTGVTYGRFDLDRLVSTIRILPKPEDDTRSIGVASLNGEAGIATGSPCDNGEAVTVALGIEEGGLHVVEELLLARYSIYSQVYYHPVRRVYDIHLKEFLQDWLSGGQFPVDVPSHLALNDNAVLEGLRLASHDPGSPGHGPATRIMERRHYKLAYSRTPEDARTTLEPALLVCNALGDRYGCENVRRDTIHSKGTGKGFPVLMRDGRVFDAAGLSQILETFPILIEDRVYVRPDLRDVATEWLGHEREAILKPG